MVIATYKQYIDRLWWEKYYEGGEGEELNKYELIMLIGDRRERIDELWKKYSEGKELNNDDRFDYYDSKARILEFRLGARLVRSHIEESVITDSSKKQKPLITLNYRYTYKSGSKARLIRKFENADREADNIKPFGP